MPVKITGNCILLYYYTILNNLNNIFITFITLLEPSVDFGVIKTRGWL